MAKHCHLQLARAKSDRTAQVSPANIMAAASAADASTPRPMRNTAASGGSRVTCTTKETPNPNPNPCTNTNTLFRK